MYRVMGRVKEGGCGFKAAVIELEDEKGAGIRTSNTAQEEQPQRASLFTEGLRVCIAGGGREPQNTHKLRQLKRRPSDTYLSYLTMQGGHFKGRATRHWECARRWDRRASEVGGEKWSLKAVLDFHKPAVALRTPPPK